MNPNILSMNSVSIERATAPIMARGLILLAILRLLGLMTRGKRRGGGGVNFLFCHYWIE